MGTWGWRTDRRLARPTEARELRTVQMLHPVFLVAGETAQQRRTAVWGTDGPLQGGEGFHFLVHRAQRSWVRGGPAARARRFSLLLALASVTRTLRPSVIKNAGTRKAAPSQARRRILLARDQGRTSEKQRRAAACEHLDYRHLQRRSTSFMPPCGQRRFLECRRAAPCSGLCKASLPPCMLPRHLDDGRPGRGGGG